MTLLIWIVASFVLCLVLAKRPHLVVLFAIATWIAVPSVGGVVFVGTTLTFHPGTWVLIIATLVLATRKGFPLMVGINRSLGTILVLVGFLVFAVVVTTFERSGYATTAFLNTFLSAVLAFALIRGVIATEPDAARKITIGVIVIAAAESVLSIAQFVTGDVLNFATQRAEFYWFRGDVSLVRTMGTLDSPLDLAMLLAVAIPLCAQIKRVPLRLVVSVLLATGAVLSQSRTGAVLAAAGLIYLVVRSGMKPGQRMLSAVVMGGVLGYFLYVPNQIAAGLWDRFEGSTLSTEAREQANAVFFESIWGHSLAGGGFTSNGAFKAEGVLQTSLENGFLMLAWDFGVPMFIVLAVTIIVAMYRGATGKALRGTVAASIVATVSAAGYSGIATQSAALVILFTVIALAAPAERTKTESPTGAPVKKTERPSRAVVRV